MRHIFWKLTLLLLSIASTANSQTQDAGGIASLAVSKSYGRNWGFKLEQEFRFNQNYSTYNRATTSLKATFNFLPKLLKAEGEYALIHQNRISYCEIRQRGSFGLSGKIEFRPFDISFTSKVQSTWRDNRTGYYKFNPKYVWRNKLECAYTIFGSPFKPYISGEVFYPVNTQYGAFIDGVRGIIGGEYRLNRRSSIELFYRIDQDIQKSNPLTMHYTGIGWQYRL